MTGGTDSLRWWQTWWFIAAATVIAMIPLLIPDIAPIVDLAADGPDAVTVEVAFKKPVFLPGKAEFRVDQDAERHLAGGDGGGAHP